MNAITPLLDHQAAAVEKLEPIRVGGLFMEMGTGKSRTAIELALRRQVAGKIDRVLWFCPVALKETIRAEIAKHTDVGPADVHVFDGRTDERSVPACFWYVIGLESMGASTRVVLTVNHLLTEGTMAVVDESSYIKGHDAKRTQRLTRLCERARYRLILTGTPLSQGVVDLYAQMRFLSPKILGYRSFYGFSANHLEYSERYPGLIVRAHNTGLLAAKVAPYVYQVTKDECLDLPEKLYETRYFSMTGEQRALYEETKGRFLAELGEDDWSNRFVILRLFSALQQIASGFLRERNALGTEHHEVAHRRLECLLDVLTSVPAEEKVIVWAKYRHDIEAIAAALRGAFGPEGAALFYGNLAEKERAAELERFRREARFFVATQSAGGHGLNLQELAHTVVYYNNPFKYSERLQSEDRCHRIGQVHKVVYTDLHCIGSIDDRIAEALAKKGNAVEAFKREVGKVKHQRTRLEELVKGL